jgi:hypothetical protein
MKAYVQFTRDGREILGTDGVSPLDARYSLDRLIDQCESWVPDRGAGYRIVRSPRFVDTDSPDGRSKIAFEKEEP